MLTQNDNDSARIARVLSGGDRRSIGRANDVARWACEAAPRFRVLTSLIDHADPVISMRAADAAEKVSAAHPEWLKPYTAWLLRALKGAGAPEVRWHLSQMITRVDLSKAEARRASVAVTEYLKDRSVIVRVAALEALVHLASFNKSLVPQAREALLRASKGTAAERARSKKLLASFSNRSTIGSTGRRFHTS